MTTKENELESNHTARVKFRNELNELVRVHIGKCTGEDVMAELDRANWTYRNWAAQQAIKIMELKKKGGKE